jgi:hypothetical protein
MIKKILIVLIGILGFTSITNAQFIQRPVQGGTGIGSVTAGDIGLCLKVLNNSPFTYELDTCGGGAGGLATSTPWSFGQLVSILDDGTVVGTSSPTVGYITATSTTASTFPYASTTMITSLLASSTNFISGWGTESAPGYSFSGDPDTGIFNNVASGGNNLSVASAGNRVFNFNNTVNTSYRTLAGATSKTFWLRSDAGAETTPTYAFDNDANTGMWSSGADILNLVTGGSNRVTVDSSGKVGIGTTEPLAKFSVGGDYNNTGTGGIMLDAYLPSPDTYSLRINPFVVGSGMVGYQFQTKSATGGTQVPLTFDNAGKVGIGKIAPAYKLDVAGIINTDYGLNLTNVTPSSPTLALVADASGLLSVGAYVYNVSYYTSIGETTPNSEAATITTDASHKKVTVTLPVSTDYRVVGRKIYRSLVGYPSYTGGLVATIADNTTTTYVDNIADGSLGTNRYFAVNTTNNFITLNNVKALTVDTNLTTLGAGAGSSITLGGRSTFIGSWAGGSVTTGTDNTYIGHSIQGSPDGNQNTIIGTYAGNGTASGASSQNTFLGAYSGFGQTSGNGNTLMGYYALANNISGGNNTVIGGSSGLGITTGSYNTIIGYGVNGLSSNLSNNIILADGSGNRRINVDSSGNVGIGTTSPAANSRLDVYGGTLTVTSVSGNTGSWDPGDTSGTALRMGYRNTAGVDAGFIQAINSGVATKPLLLQPGGGNVGIGTTTPYAKLSISNSATDAINGTLFTISSTTAGVSTSTLLAVRANGNVGVGKAAPNYRLDVAGTLATDAINSDIGLNFTNVTPGSPSLALVADASGLLSVGTYVYNVTYYTAIGETTPNSEAIQITTDASHKKVTVTLPVSTDYRVIGRKIYRSTVGLPSYSGGLVATIADNTTTTFVDNIADGSLGANRYFAVNTTNNFISLNDVKAATVDNNLTTFGVGAGSSLTTGGRSTLIGSFAGANGTTASDNVHIGNTQGSVTGSANVTVGTYAANAMYGGSSLNSMVGAYSGFYNSTGNSNTNMGYFSGFNNTTGQNNTMIGSETMTGGSPRAVNYNTVLGSAAGRNVTGDYNVFLGSYAGYYETGSNKLFIDNNQRASEADAREKALIYGVFDTATANQKLTFNANVGIGTTSPASKLTVNGHIGTDGATPTLSSCGTSPTIVVGSTDTAGEITEGSIATGCVITFASAYARAPFVTVTAQSGLVFSYTVSASAITITNVGALSGTKLNYHVISNDL